MKLLAPRVVPLGEVQGFTEESDFLDQQQVDRAVHALQEFIASAPQDDQAVYAALLAQAESFAVDNWPTS